MKPKTITVNRAELRNQMRSRRADDAAARATTKAQRRAAIQRELEGGPIYSGSDLLELAKQLRAITEHVRKSHGYEQYCHEAAILTAAAIRSGVLDDVRYTVARGLITQGFSWFADALVPDPPAGSRQPEISACEKLAAIIEGFAKASQHTPPDDKQSGLGQERRSPELSKAELARRIQHDNKAKPDRVDFDRYDIQKVPGREKKWTVRTDKMDAAMRDRVERPVSG